MKHLIFILFITTTILSCSKTQSPDCIDVSYEEYFTIQEGNTYCFPDGNSIEIQQLKNEFCPCNAVCVWEGQMVMKYALIFDGTTYEGTQGSANTEYLDYDTLNGVLHALFQNINFVIPCDADHPSPAIKNAQIKLTKV